MSTTTQQMGTIGAESTSQAVVAAVADVTERDPLTLEPLYEAIDPSALDALFGDDGPESRPAPTRLEFFYAGCEIVVEADGSIDVSERAD